MIATGRALIVTNLVWFGASIRMCRYNLGTDCYTRDLNSDNSPPISQIVETIPSLIRINN